MPCSLTLGRNEVCKESIGGLQGVYFINYVTGSFTESSAQTATPMGLLTGVPSGSILYYYELKGTSAYTETVNTSRENGTTFFSQELTLNLNNILEVTGDKVPFLVGKKEGADMTGGTIQTGGALGDLYGYSLTFTGMEQFPAQFLSGSTTTNALGGLTANYSIVYGASA